MPAKKTTKTAAKKTAVKKTVAKKAPAKKAAPVKKVRAAKAPAKKAFKNAVSKKATTTKIIANVDVGFGNSLYIRGEGAPGLSWEQGLPMENVSPYEWAFSTSAAKGVVAFKLLINDEAWADGENLSVTAGGTSISSPAFNW